LKLVEVVEELLLLDLIYPQLVALVGLPIVLLLDQMVAGAAD
jgi:hypothetical protein